MSAYFKYIFALTNPIKKQKRAINKEHEHQNILLTRIIHPLYPYINQCFSYLNLGKNMTIKDSFNWTTEDWKQLTQDCEMSAYFKYIFGEDYLTKMEK